MRRAARLYLQLSAYTTYILENVCSPRAPESSTVQCYNDGGPSSLEKLYEQIENRYAINEEKYRVKCLTKIYRLLPTSVVDLPNFSKRVIF